MDLSSQRSTPVLQNLMVREKVKKMPDNEMVHKHYAELFTAKLPQTTIQGGQQ